MGGATESTNAPQLSHRQLFDSDCNFQILLGGAPVGGAPEDGVPQSRAASISVALAIAEPTTNLTMPKNSPIFSCVGISELENFWLYTCMHVCFGMVCVHDVCCMISSICIFIIQIYCKHEVSDTSARATTDHKTHGKLRFEKS